MFLMAYYCFYWVNMDARYTFTLSECLKTLMANFVTLSVINENPKSLKTNNY